MQWLKKIPLGPLVLAAIFLGLMPFQPQPHLWEKLTMLAAGELVKPLDIFDLFWHSWLVILVLLKLGFGMRSRASEEG